ncbi:MAG: phosphoglucosamine mutase [Candidatus Thermoplasmatota archaeon]|jgi:phosphomannomutase/phosphoglucomutase|nr:phosphoglucosamine mutase [Candidatus Thermoplasmatota archaeon]MCL5800111.1 phosphoglucosamine mutase [Candidatus Thermoplasmatota archaeon]
MEKPGRLFGTNGIRGVPNEDLTSDLCIGMGRAIASHFNASRIAIARDTRQSGDYIFSLVSAGLLSGGSDLTNIGTLPTPGLQIYCKMHAIPGVMITASHNPPKYNGLKVIEPDGTEASRQTEEDLERLFHSGSPKKADWRSLGSITSEPEFYKTYVERVLDSAKMAGKNVKLKIAFDAGNGASYLTTPLLLQKTGAKLTTLNSNPDGLFTSRDSEPKPENLTALSSLMKSGEYDMGIAHDGDADRCVFYDEKGEFLDGNSILPILTKYYCKRGDTVVTPVSTSDSLEDVCRSNDIRLIRTKVGAPLVARTVIQEKAALGGEENGGIIYPRHQYCRDGAIAAMLIISIMNSTGKRLSDLLSEIPRYHVLKSSVQRKGKWEDIEARIRSIDGIQKIDETDGLKVWERTGWVLIRPSGTEPIIRVYSNAKDEEAGRKLLAKYLSIAAQ